MGTGVGPRKKDAWKSMLSLPQGAASPGGEDSGQVAAGEVSRVSWWEGDRKTLGPDKTAGKLSNELGGHITPENGSYHSLR